VVVVPRDDSPAAILMVPGSGDIDDISIWNMIGIPITVS
jgi:hypothetical protein